jgi:hypothetical protein
VPAGGGAISAALLFGRRRGCPPRARAPPARPALRDALVGRHIASPHLRPRATPARGWAPGRADGCQLGAAPSMLAGIELALAASVEPRHQTAAPGPLGAGVGRQI